MKSGRFIFFIYLWFICEIYLSLERLLSFRTSSPYVVLYILYSLFYVWSSEISGDILGNCNRFKFVFWTDFFYCIGISPSLNQKRIRLTK